MAKILKNVDKYGVFLLAAGWTVLMFIGYLGKHFWEYQTFGWDTGFFDQVIWKASRGDFGYSTIFHHSLMSSNFEPILFSLIPLVRLIPDIRVLFFVQTVVAISAVIPIYFLSRRVTKSVMFSFAVGIAYLLAVPFQHAILDGFTQSFFVAPILAWSFFFLETKRVNWYGLMLVGIVLVKEEFSLFLIPFGLVVILAYHRVKLGLVTCFFGAVMFILLIYFLNPIISPGLRNWGHYSSGYGEAGGSPQAVLVGAVTNPGKYLGLLVNSSVKRTTVFEHFGSFGFLPVFSPLVLIPVAYEYFIRFVNTTQPGKWLGHDFDFGVVLAVATIYGSRKLVPRVNIRWLCLWVFIFAIGGDLVFHGPVNSIAKSSFWKEEQWAKDNDAIILRVPRDASVAANNSLVPHLSERDKIYQLPIVADAEYVIVDLSNRPNNYAPIDYNSTVSLVSELVTSGQYKVVDREGRALLLRRV